MVACSNCGREVRRPLQYGVCGARGCKNAYMRAYYQANSDSWKQRVSRYTEANSGKVREYQRGYYSENRDQAIARAVEWNRANPDKRREASRKHYDVRGRERGGHRPRGEVKPPETLTWVYGLCDDRDRIIYIGITWRDLYDRLREHRNDSDLWRTEIAYIKPLLLTTWAAAPAIEERLIRHFPGQLHNKTHNY